MIKEKIVEAHKRVLNQKILLSQFKGWLSSQDFFPANLSWEEMGGKIRFEIPLNWGIGKSEFSLCLICEYRLDNPFPSMADMADRRDFKDVPSTFLALEDCLRREYKERVKFAIGNSCDFCNRNSNCGYCEGALHPQYQGVITLETGFITL